MGRHGRMDRQRESDNCDVGNRFQVLERVELRPVLEQRLGDVGGRTAEQERVAVRSGARGLRRTDRTAPAADVLDDDRAQQRFHSVRPRATDGVERPARREWNHGVWAASDSSAPLRSALAPAARKRPLPAAGIDGAEVSWRFRTEMLTTMPASSAINRRGVIADGSGAAAKKRLRRAYATHPSARKGSVLSPVGRNAAATSALAGPAYVVAEISRRPAPRAGSGLRSCRAPSSSRRRG